LALASPGNLKIVEPPILRSVDSNRIADISSLRLLMLAACRCGKTPD
jgi:hypothetical protein